MLLNTSLLRERFTITDKNGKRSPIIALGNRISLPLSMSGKATKERLIVRAHSMHVALKMASIITHEFFDRGPLVNRENPVNFEKYWHDIMDPFERSYNPDSWCSIYHNGRPIFQAGKHHQFLDVVEQCDIKNRREYDRAIKLAEDIFSEAGQNVTIDHDVNIGVVIGAMSHIIRCGLILRSPQRTTTFNFILEKKKGDAIPLQPHDGLELASYFLEAIQLSVTNGITEFLLEKGEITPESPRANKAQSAYNRIGKLTHAIRTYEQTHSIRYRPEKPDFMHLLNHVKQASKSLSSASFDGPIESGEDHI